MPIDIPSNTQVISIRGGHEGPISPTNKPETGSVLVNPAEKGESEPTAQTFGAATKLLIDTLPGITDGNEFTVSPPPEEITLTEGDTVYRTLYEDYGMTAEEINEALDEIARYNGITDFESLNSGRTIRIPPSVRAKMPNLIAIPLEAILTAKGEGVTRFPDQIQNRYFYAPEDALHNLTDYYTRLLRVTPDKHIMSFGYGRVTINNNAKIINNYGIPLDGKSIFIPALDIRVSFDDNGNPVVYSRKMHTAYVDPGDESGVAWYEDIRSVNSSNITYGGRTFSNGVTFSMAFTIKNGQIVFNNDKGEMRVQFQVPFTSRQPIPGVDFTPYSEFLDNIPFDINDPQQRDTITRALRQGGFEVDILRRVVSFAKLKEQSPAYYEYCKKYYADMVRELDEIGIPIDEIAVYVYDDWFFTIEQDNQMYIVPGKHLGKYPSYEARERNPNMIIVFDKTRRITDKNGEKKWVLDFKLAKKPLTKQEKLQVERNQRNITRSRNTSRKAYGK